MKIFVKSRSGKPISVDFSDDSLQLYGLKCGDYISIPDGGNATVVGVDDSGQIWYKRDEDLEVSYSESSCAPQNYLSVNKMAILPPTSIEKIITILDPASDSEINVVINDEDLKIGKIVKQQAGNIAIVGRSTLTGDFLVLHPNYFGIFVYRRETLLRDLLTEKKNLAQNTDKLTVDTFDSLHNEHYEKGEDKAEEAQQSLQRNSMSNDELAAGYILSPEENGFVYNINHVALYLEHYLFNNISTAEEFIKRAIKENYGLVMNTLNSEKFIKVYGEDNAKHDMIRNLIDQAIIEAQENKTEQPLQAAMQSILNWKEKANPIQLLKVLGGYRGKTESTNETQAQETKVALSQNSPAEQSIPDAKVQPDNSKLKVKWDFWNTFNKKVEKVSAEPKRNESALN